MTDRDRIYSQPIQKIADFKFDDNVASVFTDMINRSVPGYQAIVSMSGILASKFIQPNTTCYDLGCSLGATTLSMREHIGGGNRPNIDQSTAEPGKHQEKNKGRNNESSKDRNNDKNKIVAIDNSIAMVTRLQETLAKLPDNGVTVEVCLGDLTEVQLNLASVVALNFTLQFVPLEQRSALLKGIYQALVPSGILILSEKVRFEDPQLNQLLSELHHEFKRENGYSDLEISQKRTALENVLIPEDLSDHKARLIDIGFSSVEVWFQCFNFASLVAIK